ncbi:hypothetical protein WN55_00030 [Dufourea novaeangliae]|uniref:Uncharacterized protein n=1 Tax=Dufourea novaeangliae TaxID=178035 RepID=A0A154NWC1_DUFNO|nr:hypothetical protein WN55_00030 [Dufourea novaeangliae]
MQQGSVGGCDEDTTVPTARGKSPKSIEASKAEFANERNARESNSRVRVKVEVPESTEVFEVKREPQDEYHPLQPDYQYDRKTMVPPKIDGNPEMPGQCQAQHQGYRPMTSGLPNSYGFPHFYGSSAMLPPPFPSVRPSPDRSMGKIEEHEHEQERLRVSSVHGDGSFLHHEHHRFEIGDYHHGKPPGYTGLPYPSFRPSMQQRPAYMGHQNNSYRAAQYQNRQRKWSSAALRGFHPAMPVSTPVRSDFHYSQVYCADHDS